MNLKMLVMAAGVMALPAIAGAQNPTDTTTKRDTSMTMTHDTMTMKHDTMTMRGDTMTMGKRTRTTRTKAARSRKATAAAKESMSTEAKESKSEEAKESMSTSTAATGSGLPEQSVNGPRPVPPSDGTNCPWKCPTSKGVAGLTGAQFLALQQELRDKGCGTSHVTGVLDAPTRRAIAKCAKKLGVKNSAAAVLVAMNIGYSASDVPGSTEE